MQQILANPLGALAQADEMIQGKRRARLADLQLQAAEKRQRLGTLLPKAMAGDQQATSQIAEVDPELFLKLDENQKAAVSQRSSQIASILAGIEQAPPPLRQAAYDDARRRYAAMGGDLSSVPPTYDPAWVRNQYNSMRKVEDILKVQQARQYALSPGAQLRGPDGELLAENTNVRPSAIQQPPAAVAEWELYSKLPPDKRALYDAMKRGTPGYSSATEKQIYGASDAYVDENAAAESYFDLAQRYEQAQGKLMSGTAGTMAEWLKEQTGNQDEFTLLRKDWSKVKASEVVKNLPPGAASDSDIALALEGFLPTNADPKSVASFLRGVAKMRKLNAEYNAFKADYLSETKNPGGLRKAWAERAASIGVGGPTTSSSQSGGLQPGAVEDGYRFKGGNPADPNSWEAI